METHGLKVITQFLNLPYLNMFLKFEASMCYYLKFMLLHLFAFSSMF